LRETRIARRTPPAEPSPPAHGKGAEGRAAPRARHSNEELAATLGGEIIAGLYPPGSRLPSELSLLARFGVSRPTLREAFRVLAAKGLIVSRQKVGTSVRAKSAWNMLDPDFLAWHLRAALTESFVGDLFQFRLIIEPEAARLAALSAKSPAIDRIGAAFADMERWRTGGGDIADADLRFHQAILDATGNPFVGALGGLIHTALVATFTLGWRGVVIPEARLDQHRAVLNAIISRRPDEARDMMTVLIQASIDDVRRALVKTPGDPKAARDAAPKRR